MVYSDTFGTREEIKDYLQNLKEVKHWRFDMPNSFYIISELSATELSKLIWQKHNKGRFFITEITENRNGLLPNDTWYLIKNLKKKPKVL